MKVAVFGATGKTGIQVVQQALEQGHTVCAFVRDPKKITIVNEKLEVVVGDILNPQTVDGGISGVDAVLLALGSDKPVLAQGTKNIIDAMKKHSVRRLIVESSYPMSGTPQGLAFLKSVGMTDKQIQGVKPITDDKIAQEKAVAESGLDWIIVRPLMLTDGEKTGQYRAGETLDVKPGDNISRADVADFMLKSISDDTWFRKTVTLSY